MQGLGLFVFGQLSAVMWVDGAVFEFRGGLSMNICVQRVLQEP